MQKGLSPGPYVALATGVAVPAQDRAEFERLLKEALAIDPEKDPSNRLVTLVTQRRARRAARSHRREVREMSSQRLGGFMFGSKSRSHRSSPSRSSRRRRCGAAITIKLATQAPVNSSWHKALLDMGAEWEAKTAGRVKLTVYAGGTQGSEDATIRMMRPGVDQLQANLLMLPGPRARSTTPSTCSACRSSSSRRGRRSTSSRS